MEELKQKLVSDLHGHFDKFMEINIHDTIFKVMPVEEDIPKIESVSYSQEEDVFEIILEHKGPLREEKIGKLGIYYADDDALAGIKLYKFTDYSYSRVFAAAFQTTGETKTKIFLNEHNYRKTDIEKRKFSFFNELLVHAPTLKSKDLAFSF